MGQTKQYVCCKPLGNVSAFKIKKEEEEHVYRQRGKDEVETEKR